jgi:hypothetical protein
MSRQCWELVEADGRPVGGEKSSGVIAIGLGLLAGAKRCNVAFREA